MIAEVLSPAMLTARLALNQRIRKNHNLRQNVLQMRLIATSLFLAAKERQTGDK